jgi:hypothetical protein
MRDLQPGQRLTLSSSEGPFHAYPPCIMGQFDGAGRRINADAVVELEE